MKKAKNKYNKRKSHKKINYSFVIIIFVLLILCGLYSISFFSFYNSKKNLAKKEIEQKRELEISKEMDAKLAYLSTKEGIKHIAKKNGFVEPGEVVIQLSKDPNTIFVQVPKRNIFGKIDKIACNEHTINDKPKYDINCIECQKLNEIYNNKQKELKAKAEKEAIAKKYNKKKKENKRINLSKAQLSNHTKIKDK